MDLLPTTKEFPAKGTFHDSGDYYLIHSVLFFDSLVAHLRFDGLSNFKLVQYLGQVCDFEEGECRLAWAGAFPSFLTTPFLGPPSASWAIVDAKVGPVKEGTYKATDVIDWQKPSDLHKTNLPNIVQGKLKKFD